MEISAILTLETNTPSGIHLHLEGIFWKAYEQSAWRFVRHVRPYLLAKKHIKTVGQDVVSLGFPSIALEKVLAGIPYTQDAPKHILVTCEDDAPAEDFERWKQTVPLQTADKAPVVPYPQVPTGNELYLSIIGELERFDLLHASPMDCMQFVSSLKQQLINR